MSLPRGCFPTMITPFHEDGSIDFPTAKRLINWFIDSGCVGIFAVCLSSVEERLKLAKFVHDEVAGRVCLVASGTFGGPIEEQALFCTEMSQYCDAVVVLTCQLAKKEESDEVWTQNAQKLLDLTGNIKLGLYECPDPYKRVLTPQILKWAALSNRFFFHKDTCCSSVEIKAKIDAIKEIPNSPFRFYNANIATLSDSCSMGGDGFSGICANFYPYIVVKMVALIFSDDYNTNEESQKKVKQIQRFLSVAENVITDNNSYPVSAKVYLSESGSSITPFSRKVKCGFSEEQLIRFKDLYYLQSDFCQFLGITEIKF